MPKKSGFILFQRPYYLIFPLLLLAAIALIAVKLLSPKPHPRIYSAADISAMNSGINSLAQGDFDAAITSFTTVIKSEPSYGEAYNNRGLAYQAKGDLALAFADFQKAVKLLPGDPTPYNNRGSVYFTQGNYEKAMDDFNQAIARDPQFAKAYYNRGAIYLSVGNNAGAITEFDKAIQYTPEITGTQVTPTQPITSSLGIVDSTSQRYANLPLAYANRGSAYLGNADYEKAFKDLDKALSLKPDLSVAYYYRGLAYYSQGDYVKAITQFTNVIALNNDPEAIDMAKARLTEIGSK